MFQASFDCCQLASEAYISVDEDNENCKDGKKQADMVMKQVKKSTIVK